MTQISTQDIAKVVKEAGARYIGHATCVANKPNMLELVQTLDAYTDEVQSAAEEYGLTGDENMAQWAKDMNNWRLRLAGYYQALQHARYTEGVDSCEELRASVNEPLLVGWFEPGTPGIVNPDVQSIADVATPYMLGNQVIVYRDHQKERLDKLLEDLNPFNAETRAGMLDYWCEKTGTCGPGGWDSGCDFNCWLRRLAVVGAAAGATYLAYRGIKWAIQARAGAVSPAPASAYDEET